MNNLKNITLLNNYSAYIGRVLYVLSQLLYKTMYYVLPVTIGDEKITN